MIYIKAKLDLHKALVLTAKGMRAITTAAYRHIGEYWHARMLPKHFKTSAYGEYGYAPRTAKHNRRKDKDYGHSDPLVFSGRMEYEVLNFRDVRATSSQVKIVLTGPTYMYQYKPGISPDKVDELTRVTKREEAEIAREMDKFMKKALSDKSAQGIRLRVLGRGA